MAARQLTSKLVLTCRLAPTASPPFSPKQLKLKSSSLRSVASGERKRERRRSHRVRTGLSIEVVGFVTLQVLVLAGWPEPIKKHRLMNAEVIVAGEPDVDVNIVEGPY